MLSVVVHFRPRETIKTCTSHSPTETLVHQADGHMMKNMLAPKDRSCERAPVSQSINQQGKNKVLEANYAASLNFL